MAVAADKFSTSPTPDRLPEGYVYFIAAHLCKLIKIVFSLDPMNRIEEIRSLCPDPLELVGCIPGTKNTEQELHRKFGHLRFYGEWFWSQPELWDFISQHEISFCEYMIEFFDDPPITDMYGVEIDRLIAEAT